ncbi:MAG: CpaF family protein [Bdellovibrionales bacterium]|nr:CpaF family protein [Bdellovibrionales bacterium]
MTDFFSEATAGFLKPIASYLQDEGVSEVMVNGHDQIFVEKKGKLFKTKAQFDSEDDLLAAVRRIAQAVGRSIDEKEPIMDGRLADGSRVNAVIPPAAKKGIYLTIRKFSKDKLTMKQLVESGSMSMEMAKFINLCMVMAKNTIVSGGTSSGKTTLLNVVSSLIPQDQRIIVIEDASELQLSQDHVLPMETQVKDRLGEGQVTMRELIKSSLRMRPDRIVIGEVRGAEALDLLQAMNTGHSGSLATLHANHPKGALERLETLALMSDVDLPLRAMRSQIASAIDIIVQAQRLRDGSRRITHISEVIGIDENGHYEIQDLFVFKVLKVDEKGQMIGEHVACKHLPTFYEEAKAQGLKVDKKLFGL